MNSLGLRQSLVRDRRRRIVWVSIKMGLNPQYLKTIRMIQG
jgi:hypothetical protein